MQISFTNIENLYNMLDANEELYIDNLQWIEPVGIALLKLYKASNPDINISINGSSQSVSYIKTILNQGSSKDRSYIPIEHFNINSEKIDSIAFKVTEKIIQKATKLSKEDRDDLTKYLKYLISEMMDNVISHASSKADGFVTAQFYPTKKKVQVVIIDNGVGLLKTLSTKYELQDEQEAILKALEKEVTGSNKFESYNNIPKHAGLGLYFLSKIIEHTKGSLLIVSNDTMYRADKDNFLKLKTSLGGTMIAFEILNSELEYEFEQLFKIIQSEGDEEVEDIF